MHIQRFPGGVPLQRRDWRGTCPRSEARPVTSPERQPGRHGATPAARSACRRRDMPGTREYGARCVASAKGGPARCLPRVAQAGSVTAGGHGKARRPGESRGAVARAVTAPSARPLPGGGVGPGADRRPGSATVNRPPLGSGLTAAQGSLRLTGRRASRRRRRPPRQVSRGKSRATEGGCCKAR